MLSVVFLGTCLAGGGCLHVAAELWVFQGMCVRRDWS